MLHLTYSLVALGLAGHAAADGWDDFTNNLATDLAPIISLFGEQATKQYLSESITWLDYFIFSMAPIGILTALVSAIRVCGSSSLRAFIGRAKEGTGDVEAELLSSTSHDVCELYNKGGITRIFGRPKILEFVHDPNAPDSEFTDTWGMAGISTFQKYAETDHGKEEWEPFPECRDKFPPEEYAPNLSHNVGIKRLDYMWFVMAAILGFVLQAGVLIFAGIATYLLRLEKEGAQPPSYACPMSIIGTAMVCGGMFLCAFLVGESTDERIYARRRASESSRRSTIYWLQPPQVLGDQTFESFCYVDEGHGGSLSEYVSSWKKDNTTASWYVWLAVSVTVVGFVLQFVGFRGTHSAISMAQLGAALIMSVARAALRTQRLDTKENIFTHLGDLKDCIKGHELDWLAIRMGSTQLKNRPQASRKTDSTKITDFERLSWSFHGMADSERRMTRSRRGSASKASNQGLSVKRILAYRRALARLTEHALDSRTLSRNFANDMVSVRDMAEKLALAIESVADVFFSTATMEKSWLHEYVLSWAVKCGLSSSNGERNIEELSIHFHREFNDFGDDGIHWRLDNRHNLEGILGLWLWSLISNHEPVTAGYRRPGALDRSTTPKRRIISFDDDPEVLGFNIWNRGNWPYTLKEMVMAANDKCNPSTIWHQNDQGTFIPLETDKVPPSIGTRYCQRFGWYTGEGHTSTSGSTESLTPRQTWTIPATSNTLSLCAQEMLGVFVKSILNATVGIGQVELDSTNRSLKSILVSKALDAIVASDVASTDDAIWCILPQVVVKERLGGRTLLWHAASIGYEKLVDFLLRDKGSDAEQNDPESNFDMELGDSGRGRTPLWQAAANGHEGVVRILLNHGANAETADKEEITALVKAAENGCQAVVRMLIERGGADTSRKSAFGRTALHLAAANGHAGVVQLLLEEGADDKVTDQSNATPLSLAIDSGHATTIKLLNAHRADHRTHMSHQSTENDEIKLRLAEDFMSTLMDYSLRLRKVLVRKPQRDHIKVALLCSGIDVKGSPFLRGCMTRGLRFEGKAWVEGWSWREDRLGFGTKLASLLVEVCARVDVFVAKITDSSHIDATMIHVIPQAIEYATSAGGWDVDVLVLPFGMPVVDKGLKDALTAARKRGKIILAAASALGGTMRRGFPAMSPQCIAIHGVDGRGRDCGISPSPVKGEPNFSTVGAGLLIPEREKKSTSSGSAYAVGVAAGIVASFLDFARSEVVLDQEEQRWLFSNDGIRQMLLLISTKIDGYEFLTPWELFGKQNDREDIGRIIKMVIWKNKGATAHRAR